MPAKDSEWMDRIACRGVNMDQFVDGGTAAKARKFAQDYCGVCPVHRECLEFGLRTNSAGVFGGYRLKPWAKQLKRKRLRLI